MNSVLRRQPGSLQRFSISSPSIEDPVLMTGNMTTNETQPVLMEIENLEKQIIELQTKRSELLTNVAPRITYIERVVGNDEKNGKEEKGLVKYMKEIKKICKNNNKQDIIIYLNVGILLVGVLNVVVQLLKRPSLIGRGDDDRLISLSEVKKKWISRDALQGLLDNSVIREVKI